MPHPLIPDTAFPPGRNEPCFCGSGRRFKRCCGSQADDRAPPFRIGIVDRFMTPDECSELVSLADGIEGRPFTLPDGRRGRQLDDQLVTD